jgi:hypothetical protein
MYLVQDVITDCSVVASLCAAAAWENTHSSQVPYPLPNYQIPLGEGLTVDCDK